MKATRKPAAPITIALPTLKKGEHYAGLIITDGKPTHHLVLLPGELPTRREQSLLFANIKDQFKPEWYWSGEQHASNPSFAWLQSFYYGYQVSTHTDDTSRARAVRRVTI